MMLKIIFRKLLEIQKQAFLLTCISREKKPLVLTEKVNRFLCVQMNAIGDSIMSQPVWASLKSAFPASDIDLMCRPHIAPLFKKDPAIRNIIPALPRKYRSWLFKNDRFILEAVRQNDYDIVIDFSGQPYTAGLCARVSTVTSIGLELAAQIGLQKIDLGLCYDITVPCPETMNLRELFFQLIFPLLRSRRPLPRPTVLLDKEVSKKADDLLKTKGLVKGNFIVLHPGGKWQPKRWPPVKWNRLATRIFKELDYKILILGGKEDQDLLHEIVSGPEPLECLRFPSNDIEMSCAIIGAAGLCVCNDSAAMHMAAAMGTKTIALFGVSPPSRTAPPAEEGCSSFYENTFCSPCTLYYSSERCRRGINFCMQAIDPEKVFAKVKQISTESGFK